MISVLTETRHILDGGCFEQRPEWNLHTEFCMYSSDDPTGFQRISAEIEETVGYAHGIEPQYFAPVVADRALDRATRTPLRHRAAFTGDIHSAARPGSRTNPSRHSVVG